MFVEYPKVLYRETETLIVSDESDEKAAKGHGWKEAEAHFSDEEESAPAEAPKRRGRPPKVVSDDSHEA